MLNEEGGLAIKSGGDMGLKPYKASKARTQSRNERSYYNKTQQGAVHATNHDVVHGQNLLESAQ